MKLSTRKQAVSTSTRISSRRRKFAAVLLGALLVGGSIATAAPANAIVIGVCTMKAQNPHGSVHVSGTINAVGTASCSVVMDEIYVHTVLERSDGVNYVGDTNDYFNTSYEMSNAATSCSNGPGVFRTRLSYVLYAPAGVNPSYAANTIYSQWISVACGVAKTATSTSAGATDEVTFDPIGASE